MSHMKICMVFLMLIFVSLLIFSCNGLISSRIKVDPDVSQLNQYETLIIHITLRHPFDNPFDSEEICVNAVFKTPQGQTLYLPCFYKAGTRKKSTWEGRFTASQAGSYIYFIEVASKRDSSVSKTLKLDVTPSNQNGFLRLNPNSSYTFLFDSGKPFRGIGINLGWELPSNGRYSYESYFNELAKNRANIIRTWLCPWNLSLEWSKVSSYISFSDELGNWEKMFDHTAGLKLSSDKTRFCEDDTSRIIIDSDNVESIVYHLNDMRKFKIKLYYKNYLSQHKIKCYSSVDNKLYTPIDIQFSQPGNTAENWYCLFIAGLNELAAGTNYLKIEFLSKLEGTPQLANIQIEFGKALNISQASGLTRYNQQTAERLDDIFHQAEKLGIFIILTLDYYGVFNDVIDYLGFNADWRANPYNAANGGPCATPTDFFTKSKAKKIYKNKLRYLVARWGYSTHLACWEFWDEIDNVMATQHVPAEAIINWHQEMVDFLKQIDPYQHLVSTSVSQREISGLWDIKNIDFAQHHHYGSTINLRDSLFNCGLRLNKPDVIGEFALGWKGPGKDEPAELYESEWHNGLWRGLFSPTPILPLSWWWQWHFDNNQFYHLKMVADFVSLIEKDEIACFQDIPVSTEHPLVEILGFHCGEQMAFWARNHNSYDLKDLTLEVMANEDSTKAYLVKYYDTWEGSCSDDFELGIIENKLILNDINLKTDHDIAIWLRPFIK